MMERVDPVLWALSRDFVGDTAETTSLLWPTPLGDVLAGLVRFDYGIPHAAVTAAWVL